MELLTLTLATMLTPILALLVILAAYVAQLPELSPVVDLVEAVVRLASIVLPVIGITGGINGLVGKLPSFRIRKWEIKPGLYISWTVALPLTALAYVNGWLPELGTFESAEAAIAAYWATLAATANIVRNAIVGRGGGPEPEPAG